MPLANEKTAAEASTVFHRALAPGTSLHAVIDLAKESAGLYQAELAELHYQSLFSGDLGDKLVNVAPILVSFPSRGSFRPWWFSQWGNSIGILVEAPVSMDELRAHFRRFTIVSDAQRKKYFFRFYDPRVLRVFLPACTVDEARDFFGPIAVFHCESEGGAELLSFSLGRQGVDVKRRPIVSAATATPPSTPAPPARNPYRKA